MYLKKKIINIYMFTKIQILNVKLSLLKQRRDYWMKKYVQVLQQSKGKRLNMKKANKMKRCKKYYSKRINKVKTKIQECNILFYGIV